jgi:CRP-like cAMP-binding protein
VADALISFPLAFGSMPGELVTALRPHATVMKAKAGRTLVSPDSGSAEVYWVAQGRVQVMLLSPAGQEVILRDQGAGDMFGEIAAIDRRPRSATIIALDDCVLVRVPGPVFCDAVFGHPVAARWLAMRLTARIRDLTDRVFELNALRVPDRLYCELLRLCGADWGDSNIIVLDPFPTQTELAARIGARREAVSREMGYLSRRGIIGLERRKLTILDLAGLTKLVRRVASQTERAVERSA